MAKKREFLDKAGVEDLADMKKPFAKKVEAEAKRFAEAYDMVLRVEDGEWYGHALEYPEAMGDGKTPAACIKATRAALVAAVATMIEAGQRPPAPARKGVRDQQVNIRLTSEEKVLMETSASNKGFQGLSDFLRTAGKNFAMA